MSAPLQHVSNCGAERGGALQVFDKALTETKFTEVYADLCFQLNAALPTFEPPSQDANKRTPSTFRSVFHLSHHPPICITEKCPRTLSVHTLLHACCVGYPVLHCLMCNRQVPHWLVYFKPIESNAANTFVPSYV